MIPIDLDRLVSVLLERGKTGRHMTAIVGAPGSGKSTLAAALVNRLGAGVSAVLPMDGYHFDNAVLEARGAMARKGAAHTFDVSGLHHTIARLQENEEPEIAVPVFDRELEVSRNAARVISSDIVHVIAEGNYLLLNEVPWKALRSHFQTTVFLDVPFEELQRRLENRWANLSHTERRAKIDGNDLPNAKHVISQSADTEFVIRAD